MEDGNTQHEGHLDSSTDKLSSSIKKRFSLRDDTEKDQQQQQQHSSLLPNRRLSNISVCSLLDVETDHEAIESLELLLNSVVKIFCTTMPCNFISPW
jgi:hypothetical protein